MWISVCAKISVTTNIRPRRTKAKREVPLPESEFKKVVAAPKFEYDSAPFKLLPRSSSHQTRTIKVSIKDKVKRGQMRKRSD